MTNKNKILQLEIKLQELREKYKKHRDKKDTAMMGIVERQGKILKRQLELLKTPKEDIMVTDTVSLKEAEEIFEING